MVIPLVYACIKNAQSFHAIKEYFRDQAVTYEQLEERSNRFANGFKDLGVAKNDNP